MWEIQKGTTNVLCVGKCTDILNTDTATLDNRLNLLSVDNECIEHDVWKKTTFSRP